MTDRCINIDQIDEILNLAEDHPTRLHVNDCPRCSSLFVSFQSFVEARPGSGMDLADADRRLGNFLEDRIGEPVADVAVLPEPDGGGGWFARFIAAINPRPVLATAAVVVVLSAAIALWWQPWVSEGPVLRNASSVNEMEMNPPEILPDGSVQFSWPGLKGADQYFVVLNDLALDEIARLDAGLDTSYVLVSTALPEGAPEVLICRILAFQVGDKIAQSPPVTIDFP